MDLKMTLNRSVAIFRILNKISKRPENQPEEKFEQIGDIGLDVKVESKPLIWQFLETQE